MKKVHLLIATLLATCTVSGQNFNEVTPSSIINLSNSESAMADVDNDGHLDIIIAGYSYENSIQADTVIVYRNDGAGNFNGITGNSFDGIRFPAFDLADVDGDGNIDLMIAGTHNGTKTTKLYLNDGNGVFTEVTNTVFDPVERGTVNFADVDNDGDMDVLLTGRTNGYNDISKLYINDGNGNFTEQPGTPFTGLRNGVVEFADINGNGNLDLIANGEIYFNDGNANFTVQNPNSITFFSVGDIAFEDVDNDGDLDVLITGAQPNQSQPIYTKLYLNDGNGVFTEQTATSFTDLRYSSVGFVDYNGNNSPDLFIAGLDANGDRQAQFFENDGTGNFTLAANQPTEVFSNGAITFGDVDGDQHDDLLVTGITTATGIMGPYDTRYTRLFIQCNLELDQPTLNTINAVCKIDQLQAPTASDNCSGGPTTLTATTNTSFPVTDTSINEIVWNYDNGNGLFSSQTQTINWQSIDISTTVNQETINANNTENGVTYQWMNCATNTLINGETSASFTPSHGGNYAVIITQNGCQDTSSCKTIEFASVHELNKENVIIAPNPSKSGHFKIQSNNQIVELEVFDYLGRSIQKQKSNTEGILLDLSSAPKGVYTLLFKTKNQQVSSTKIVIE